MTLSIITRDITDPFGNLLEGATVTVRQGHEAGGSLANLFSDVAGETAISNPVTVASGTLSVYVQPGRYRLEGTSSAGSGVSLADATPVSPKLENFATLAGGANKLPYFTGADSMEQTDLTAAAQSLLGREVIETQNATDTTAGRLVAMRSDGFFGWGNTSGLSVLANIDANDIPGGSIWRTTPAGTTGTFPPNAGTQNGILFQMRAETGNGNRRQIWAESFGAANMWHRRQDAAGDWLTWRMFYDTENTTVDANGFIKEASPIVRLSSDGIEDPAQPVGATFERVDAGHYALTDCPPLATKGWQVAPAGDGEGGVAATVDPPIWVGDTLHVFTRVDGVQADIPAGTFALLRFWSGDVDEEGVPISDPPEPERMSEADFAALLVDRSKDAIKARRNQAINSGITVAGVPVATDDLSQSRVGSAALAATIDASTKVKWKGSDGGFVTLDAPTIIAIAQAVRAHVQACFDREAELLTSLDADDPYDIDAGWPDGA